ncbi:MAG TPA: hypothetical protein VL201_01395, partial [Patescibacteria group bacterium]|nr:hypothetical protein [Patescibacteria group bacterium]
VDQYNAEDLIVLLNRIKEKINSHSLRAENAKKKSDIDDLLITFDAASLAMQKVVETFVNPAVDVIPNFDLLYIQISKVHEKYLDLIQAQKVSPQEQDTFLNAYKKVLQSLDTHIIVFANKILSYIESKENLFEINTWLRSLVAAYAKGTKKINTLAVDNEIQFKTYAKLLHVLSDLFVKGVALEGNQSVNLKIIVKRGFVEQRFMTEFENHINTLFNTAKDTNGLIKGLISRAIEFIDNVLLLAQEYMATVDILIVKAYQIQITPVVRLLEELFAMENELVVPELQKFVKRNISAPFSSSTILEDARKLIDPVHAIDFALHVSSTTTGAKATSTVASAGTQEVSSPLMQSIVTLLDEIQSDVHAKLTSMHIPTVVPSFADEYKDMVNAEALYGDTKQEFSKQDRELYKSKTVQVMQSIDAAVMQVALKTALFVCQPGGLFEKQLAYIANVYMSFIQGKSDMFDIVTSAEYNIVLEQAKLLQKLCQEGLAPLKKVSAATLEVGTLKKDVQNLNDFLNSMLNSTLDVKSKNTPTGLCDKLIAKWLKFFEDWKKSVKKSTVAEIQKMQSKLKPAIDLLYCYQEVITVLKTVSQHMPILHTELQNSFIETIKNILDPAQAHAFIEVSVNSDSMQSKQTVAAGGALTVAAKTTPTSPSNTGSTQKTDKVSSESNSVKKVSPTFTVLENFTKLKNDFASAVTRLDLAKGVVPDIQQFFDSVEKGKDSFEFDTALQAVSTEDVAKVEAVYQGLLLFGMQQAFKIGKSALEYGNSSMGLLVKDLLTVLKTYETDSKKIAGMKKDQALKNVCDRIKVFDGLYTKSIFTLSAIKGIKAKGTIDDLDAFLKQLNILVDSTIKNNKYVGLLNQLIDAWQLLFNECLSYMKTLTVDQVITFQQELVYLQDVCVLLDKFVTKTISIVDGERVKIKNGLINSSFSATLQKITKRENAALYAKGSSGESTDVQRALISLSDSGSKKK